VIDSSNVDGSVEVVLQGTSGTIPLNAASPLRLSQAAGASVNAAVMSALGPMT
jgi:hypothetical protein